jgi:putative redox protein
MKAKVTLAGGMRFVGHADSGHTVTMDTASPLGGQDTAPHPSELILLGLGGCTGMDVISILRKKRQPVSGLEIVVRGEQAREHPRKFLRISIEFHVRGEKIDPEAVRRAVELSEGKYCSVGASLRDPVEITTSFRIRSPDGRAEETAP